MTRRTLRRRPWLPLSSLPRRWQRLLPLFLLVSALFSAVAASANTQDEERLQALEKTVLELQQDTEEDAGS